MEPSSVSPSSPLSTAFEQSTNHSANKADRYTDGKAIAMDPEDDLLSPITVEDDSAKGTNHNEKQGNSEGVDPLFDYTVLNNKNHDVFSADQERVDDEMPVSRSEVIRRNFLKERVPKLHLKDDDENENIAMKNTSLSGDGKTPGTNVSKECSGNNGGGGGNNELNNDDGSDNSITHVESDFLQTNITSRKSVRLTSALLHYARPDGLNLVALGTSHSLDTFARLNNGIRRSMIDLYNMVDTMRRQVQDMRTATIRRFFTWWTLFASFLTTSLDIYYDIFLPWIVERMDSNTGGGGSGTGTNNVGSHGGSSDDVVVMRKRKNECDNRIELTQTVKTVEETVTLFSNIRNHVTRRAPDETIARIIRALEKLAGFPRFLQVAEDRLPDIIDQECGGDIGGKSTISEREFLKLHRRVLRYLHNHGSSAEKRRFHVLLVERGMTFEEMAAWRTMVPFHIRVATWASKTKFEKKYMNILREIC